MTTRDLVRRHVSGIDSERSLSARARSTRWNDCCADSRTWAPLRVLDLGGVPRQWVNRSVRPAQVVSLNLESHPQVAEPGVVAVRGDACDPPPGIRGERFDLVYSNSVFEHVGGHARRLAFADTVHAAADHH